MNLLLVYFKVWLKKSVSGLLKVYLMFALILNEGFSKKSIESWFSLPKFDLKSTTNLQVYWKYTELITVYLKLTISFKVDFKLYPNTSS